MTLVSAQVAAVSHIKIYASSLTTPTQPPPTTSGPAEYTPLALLVIVVADTGQWCKTCSDVKNCPLFYKDFAKKFH